MRQLLMYTFILSAAMMAAQESATCPDQIAWKGKYRNYSYGFSIVIPVGLQGFWNSARCAKQGDECICMSDHGRVIPIGNHADGLERQMEAFADYGADLGNGTVSDAMTARVQSIRDSAEAHSTAVIHKWAARLGTLTARRYVVRYKDKKANAWMIEDFAEAMGGGRRYMLYLRTPELRYAADRLKFEHMISSFRLVE